MLRFAILVLVGGSLLSGAGAPAVAQVSPTGLAVVVRLPEPVDGSGAFKFDSKTGAVRVLTGAARKSYFTRENCAPGEGGKQRCFVIDTIRAEPEKRCRAVLLDTERELVTLKDFKIGVGETEDAAIRDAFIGSDIYDDLYLVKRITYPLLLPAFIDEMIFTKETSWLSQLLGSGCPAGGGSDEVRTATTSPPKSAADPATPATPSPSPAVTPAPTPARSPSPARVRRSGAELNVVLRVREPEATTGRFPFDPKKDVVVALAGSRNLSRYLAEPGCRPPKESAGKGGRICHVLATVVPSRPEPCIAVLQNRQAERLELGDFRLGRGETEDEAIRAAFFGSYIYDRLYWERRFASPFNLPSTLDEAAFQDGANWRSQLLLSACAGEAIAATPEPVPAPNAAVAPVAATEPAEAAPKVTVKPDQTPTSAPAAPAGESAEHKSITARSTKGSAGVAAGKSDPLVGDADAPVAADVEAKVDAASDRLVSGPAAAPSPPAETASPIAAKPEPASPVEPSDSPAPVAPGSADAALAESGPAAPAPAASLASDDDKVEPQPDTGPKAVTPPAKMPRRSVNTASEGKGDLGE